MGGTSEGDSEISGRDKWEGQVKEKETDSELKETSGDRAVGGRGGTGEGDRAVGGTSEGDRSVGGTSEGDKGVKETREGDSGGRRDK